MEPIATCERNLASFVVDSGLHLAVACGIKNRSYQN